MHIQLFSEDKGQAVAEFCIALLVLLPLVFWILRFTDFLNERTKGIEMSRYAVWEAAYGRESSDIRERVIEILKSSSFFTSRNSMTVEVNPKTESTRKDILSLSYGFGHTMPQDLDLKDQNYFTCSIHVKDNLIFGLPVSTTSRYGLISNPWHLTDRNQNGSLDDKDLELAVNGIYFWPVFNDQIRQVLDLSQRIQSNWAVQWLVSITGQSLDIDPRGHPKLDSVPMPAN